MIDFSKTDAAAQMKLGGICSEVGIGFARRDIQAGRLAANIEVAEAIVQALTLVAPARELKKFAPWLAEGAWVAEGRAPTSAEVLAALGGLTGPVVPAPVAPTPTVGVAEPAINSPIGSGHRKIINDALGLSRKKSPAVTASLADYEARVQAHLDAVNQARSRNLKPPLTKSDLSVDVLNGFMTAAIDANFSALAKSGPDLEAVATARAYRQARYGS